MAAASVVLAALALLAGAPALATTKLEIVTLSNRPDKLSGGGVLVKVVVPAGTPLSDVTVKLNRREVTGQFWEDPAAHALVGLVTGLDLGANWLEAKAGGSADRLDLQNYPLAGPVFSGPQVVERKRPTLRGLVAPRPVRSTTAAGSARLIYNPRYLNEEAVA